jgi:hypothetical protein
MKHVRAIGSLRLLMQPRKGSYAGFPVARNATSPEEFVHRNEIVPLVEPLGRFCLDKPLVPHSGRQQSCNHLQ